VYQLNYFDNANSALPDALVRISNPGTTYAPTASGAPIDGDICAMIYVFRPDQQLTECCGCKLTPNALLKLSVNKNLTANPLDGTRPTAGVIKIISTEKTKTPGPVGSSKVCDPGSLALVPTPALRAWGTHVDDTGAITETEFQRAALSTTELQVLEIGCTIITGALIPPGLGSSHGTCDCTDVLSGTIDP